MTGLVNMMWTRDNRCFFLKLSLFFTIVLVRGFLWGALEVDVTEGTVVPNPFQIVFENQDALSKDVGNLLGEDLSSSGVFRRVGGVGTQTSFSRDALIRLQGQSGAHFLVSLNVTSSRRECRVRVRMYDLLQMREISTFEVTAKKDQWRRCGHQIADRLYSHVTKTPGYFDTQIAYVAGLGQGGRRSFALGLMDSDGSNRRYLRRFNSLVKTPFYDVDNGRLFYIRNKTRDRMQIFELDLYWDQEYLLDVKGDVFSLRPVEGTKYLALAVRHRTSKSYARDHSSVGLLNVSSGRFSEIVAPAPYIFISATGQALQQTIVFNSDHKGTPQLYATGMSGGRLLRLSRESGRYYSPMCSKTSKKIAFMKRNANGFNIGVMSPNGRDEKIVATFYWAESPCWAPTGNALVFVASHSPRQAAQVYRLDMNSLKLHCIKTPDEAMEPFWARFK